MKAGWIVLGWTGRVWHPYHDTAARTRTEAIAKWRRPFGVDEGWPWYEKSRRAGFVKAVPLLAFTPGPGGKR